MSRLAFLMLAFFSCAASANDTLRIGNRVLTTGDSAARVLELLGKPQSKHGAARSGARHARATAPGSERWQYRRGKRVTTLSFADGKVVHIEERPL